MSTSMIQEQKFLMPTDVAYNICCELSKKMNNIKNDLVMQDLVNPLPFGKRSNSSPIQSKENQMEAIHLI